MSQPTRNEVLKKLRWRYQSAGPKHKGKLLDQAQELLGYHREAAIRSSRAPTVERGPRIVTGRPVTYEPELLLPYLRPIWQATDYACGRRLVAMLPEWIPAYEQHERRILELPAAIRAATHRAQDPVPENLARRVINCFDRAVTRKALLRKEVDMKDSVAMARQLGEAHGWKERHATFDLWHLAAAWWLSAGVFLTFDQRQAKIADLMGMSR